MSAAALTVDDAAPAAAPPADSDRIDPGKLAVFAVMALGMFMAILDIQIVAASLSEIQAGLAASSEEVSWIQTSYLIAEVMMIPISGYLSRALSTRVIFALSAGGFTLASLGCGLSWNMESLIVMRAIQGFVGGAMIPTVFATSFSAFPRSRAGQLSAAIGLIVTLAPTIGPTLGGAITEHLSWHWLFFVNIVPGTIITVVIWLYGEFDKPDFSLLKRFDVSAFFLMAVFLGLLEYVLEEAPGDDWFDSPTITTLTVISAVSGFAFFWRSLKSNNPLVDFTTYRNGNFSAGSFIALVMGTALFSLVYLLPLFLARVRGFNALQIGETLAVTGVAMFLTAPVAGMVSRKVDPRATAAFGLVIVIFSTRAFAGLTGDWGYWQLFWPQIGRGVGMMFTMASLNVIALGTLPNDKLKGAAGLFNLMRNMGGALGLAIINTILTDRTAYHARVLADFLDPSRPVAAERLAGLTALMRQQGVADPSSAAIATLTEMVHRQASVLAFADTMRVIMWACVFAAFTVLLAKSPKHEVTGGH